MFLEKHFSPSDYRMYTFHGFTRHNLSQGYQYSPLTSDFSFFPSVSSPSAIPFSPFRSPRSPLFYLPFHFPLISSRFAPRSLSFFLLSPRIPPQPRRYSRESEIHASILFGVAARASGSGSHLFVTGRPVYPRLLPGKRAFVRDALSNTATECFLSFPLCSCPFCFLRSPSLTLFRSLFVSFELRIIPCDRSRDHAGQSLALRDSETLRLEVFNE